MATVSFSPLINAQDPQCAICQNAEKEKKWVFHNAPTSQRDQNAQHVFHRQCLKKMIVEAVGNAHCPLCREGIENGTLFKKGELERSLNFKLNNLRNSAVSIINERFRIQSDGCAYLSLGLNLITYGIDFIFQSTRNEFRINDRAVFPCLLAAGVGGFAWVMSNKKEISASFVNVVVSTLFVSSLIVIDPLFLRSGASFLTSKLVELALPYLQPQGIYNFPQELNIIAGLFSRFIIYGKFSPKLLHRFPTATASYENNRLSIHTNYRYGVYLVGSLAAWVLWKRFSG